MRKLFSLLLLLAAFPLQAQMQVEKPWLRATAPGAKVAGGYLVLRNTGAAADRLVAASSPAAAKIELHVHINDNGVMKMREVPGYDVPAKGSFELKPGGAHLMFVNIKAPFKSGDHIPVVLRFQRAGEVKVDFVVGDNSPAKTESHHKH